MESKTLKKAENDGECEQETVISFNVGGKVFMTTRNTIFRSLEGVPSLLKESIDSIPADANGEIFIDRDPEFFQVILDYLRSLASGILFILPPLAGVERKYLRKRLLAECDYYSIGPLKEFIIANSMFDSKILKESKLVPAFLNLLRESKKDKLIAPNKEWLLIYRATEHGFEAADFHKRCDANRPTLTIIRTNLGYIFGGFTNATWSSANTCEFDKDAFLFSLANVDGKPTVMNQRHQPNSVAICCNKFIGPAFGFDLEICDLSNSHYCSTSRLGYNYEVPLSCVSKHHSYLAGASHFIVSEIEVFKCS